ncbi:MAG: hypothetical protein HYS18_01680 [Burkholderiales bacterium]|nr:hypothetical protein [Burkholderiales bacterium]
MGRLIQSKIPLGRRNTLFNIRRTQSGVYVGAAVTIALVLGVIKVIG